jgi:uncharacterized protein YecE (DUF72 family)
VLKLAKLPAKDKLSTFDGLFTCLEIDTDLHHPPQEAALHKLLQNPFERLIWHIDIEDAKDLITPPPEFALFLTQLSEAKREQMIVLSFQHDLIYSEQHLSALLEYRDSIPFPCLLESSHRSWKTIKAQTDLSNAKVAQVAVDAPRLYGIIKDITEISRDHSYLRLLGRNSRTWFEPIPKKHEHLYTSGELTEISERIRSFRQTSEDVTVIFATHPFTNTHANARELVRRLSSSTLLD